MAIERMIGGRGDVETLWVNRRNGKGYEARDAGWTRLRHLASAQQQNGGDDGETNSQVFSHMKGSAAVRVLLLV